MLVLPKLSAAFAVAVALCLSPATAQVVTDDFDADTSANYTIVSSGDSAVTFLFDYSTLGIPPAPNTPGGTTLGVKLEANITSAAAHGVTVHTNQTFTGDRVIRFDAWLNANGPFPGGGAGSTEYMTWGVGGDGATVNLGGTSGSGLWFTVDGEGGSSRDYRAYKVAGEQFAESGQFCAGTSSASGGAHNNSHPYYAGFGGIDVANLPVQGANSMGGFANQTGVTAAGTFGFAWHEVTIEINADGGTGGASLVTWSIDGLPICKLDAGIGSGAPYSTDGTVNFGFMDIFSSLSSNPVLSFGVIDNLRISPARPVALQLTEVAVTPTAGEFVEIFNPSSGTVDLSNYYLTDATFASGSTYYWQLTTGGGGGGSFGDFFARFPAGATIAPGEYQTIALAGGAVGFNATYTFNPTYELFDTDPTVPDMLEATPGSINGQGGLTNAGEMCVLLHWDGSSDLVTDCDYTVWGDKDEAVDKTGVMVGSSTYLPDTPIASQQVVAGATSSSHAIGNSWQRLTNSEGLEIATGGNGADGSNETSENAATTWVEAAVTPGGPAVGAVVLIIQPDSGVGPTTIDVDGGPSFANGVVALCFAGGVANVPLPFCPGEGLRLDLGTLVILPASLDAAGILNLVIGSVPDCQGTLHVQAVAFDSGLTTCRVTNAVVNTY